MNKLFAALAVLSLFLASCKSREEVEPRALPPGRVVTSSDPRDAHQCKAQPTLLWCERQCSRDPQWEGCTVVPAH